MRNTLPSERANAGRWLRDRRIKLELTQREIAHALGLEYITMISQIEAGKAKVPPRRYGEYARVLRMDPKDFVRELLRHYDPEAWKILFAGNHTNQAGRGGHDDN